MKNSTFKKTKETKKEEEIIEFLRSLAVEVDGEFFLPNVGTINIRHDSSSAVLKKLKAKKKIINLGKLIKLDPWLIRKIKEKLAKEPNKKEQWFWKEFFMNPLWSKRRGGGIKYFINTSVLYKIKP